MKGIDVDTLFKRPWRDLLVSHYRLLLVVLLVLLVTVLHYLTSNLHTPFHDIYRRLYYLPIVLGGVWFGLRGGLLAAVSVSLLYLPHVLLQLVPFHGNLLEQMLEMLLYHVVGGVTGLLSQRERHQQKLYQQTAERLERSYAQLRRQADELIAAEMDLRSKDRLSILGEMSAGLAHEIRNPLGSIRMAAEVVTEGLTEGDQRYEFAQILQKETQRLNNVLEDYLGLARAPADKAEKVMLQEIFSELKVQLSPLAATSGVVINIEVADEYLFVESLPLRQALLNLAQNGIQSMARGGGTLALSAHREADQLVLRVSDNGEGMQRDVLEKMFTPFYTTREHGTGLGLAITQRLVQRLGGDLQVDSEPGAGTTFYLRLPMKQQTARSATLKRPDVVL
ncbi:two-component system sensor histidine kinase NtrB [Pelovirga terrestris]|uniref:histidine kinase n=1 Tax=Pelovirga terrestris TaxID=2771352 RepID=A0A8J6QN35_9BACT|nr:HAMP domain-containing sensor histidine kinase [Pelovirga terrestris]MBD1400507.1 HAMP domain-containing histidine kinase [Pelovirga terrestris]